MTSALRPTFDSSAVAEASFWPVTFGTVTLAGPLEMNTVTRVPRSICWPPDGDVRVARPLAIASEGSLWTVVLKPCSLRTFLAFASGRFVTSGTTVVPGPSDTVSVMVEPFLVFVPGCGSSRRTRSLTTVLVTPWRSTLNPALMSTVRAASNCLPTTSGTAAFSGRVRAKARPAPASSRMTASAISQRLRRRRRSSSSSGGSGSSG